MNTHSPTLRATLAVITLLFGVGAPGVPVGAQERREITAESYWYNKAIERVLQQSETETHITGTIQARHNLSYFRVRKSDAADPAKKTLGMKTATEELINWLGSTTLEFARLKLRQLTGEQFSEQREWQTWWDVNAPYLAWFEDRQRFVVDEEAKRARVPTEHYRKTHPWPKTP